MNNIKAVIWDWNGTLLDDIDVCIDSINYILRKRKLKLVTKKYYRELFTFPVREYYEKLGFDFSKESFDELAFEFVNLYKYKLKDCSLFEDTVQILSFLKRNDYKQYILSAMEQNDLIFSVKEEKINKYFNDIIGINNHFAKSKLNMGMELIKKIKVNPDEICLIGDTLHDYEVSQELRSQCILVANGHQSYSRLLTSKVTVVKKLKNLINYFS